MKKVLITGITGFAGSYLAEHLVSRGGFELHGTYLTDRSLENVDSIKDSLHLNNIDLTDGAAVRELIENVLPDEVYHLAALPSAADSFADPTIYIHNNIDVELHLLEALRKSKPDAKLLIVSSAEIYGHVDEQDLPIDENSPFRPASPYGVSKVAQDLLGLQYYLSYKMPIVRVRPFNHIGPRQSPSFVVASFAKQIAECEKSSTTVIKVGNLSAKRDFTDVRDMVKAYVAVMDAGVLGDVYNLGKGESVSVQHIVDTLIQVSGHQITTEIDQARLRPSDTPDLVCDIQKISSLGWKAEIPLEQTLKDTLDYWRAKV